LNLALALLTAALLALAQPNPNFTYLSFVAIAPLIVAVARERDWRRRFALGWSAGIVYWFAVCYWIQFVLEVHGGMGRWGGWGTFILFCLYKGLHMGVFSVAAGFIVDRWYAVPAIAALWTGIERTHGPLGFAWLTLGNAGTDMPLLPRLAPVLGVYGISFVFALTGAAVAVATLRRPRQALPWLALAVIPAFSQALPPASCGTDIAAVLQPNFSEEQEWTGPAIHKAEKELADRSLALALQSPRASLLVWPETPGPLYFYNDPQFRDTATTLARTSQTYFLFGTVAYAPDNAPLNSAVLLTPGGDTVARYDKMYLVPFGEFIPPLFGWVNRITKEAGDFVPGTRVVVSPVGSHALGTFICYESAFPHLVRQFAAQGADVFANISNDGYFGHSGAREQHLQLVRMRAIENRRWIVRGTNDGVTASIDPAGRIAARLPLYAEAGGRLPFGYESTTTFYTLHGDWFAWSCLAVGAIAVACGYRVWRSNSG
jgi:apolipoprotein N-acyltransferase